MFFIINYQLVKIENMFSEHFIFVYVKAIEGARDNFVIVYVFKREILKMTQVFLDLTVCFNRVFVIFDF